MGENEFLTLLEAARNGCGESLGRLLNNHRGYLLAIANAEVHTDLAAKAGASDLVQQTFAEAYQAIDRFRGGSPEEFLGWLRRILVHNVADLKREFRGTAARNVTRERQPTDSQPIDMHAGGGITPSAEVSSREETQRLEAALARLPEEYRQVIELRNRDRLRFAEIGERMNRSEDAVRMLWSRAVERLQAELAPE